MDAASDITFSPDGETVHHGGIEHPYDYAGECLVCTIEMPVCCGEMASAIVVARYAWEGEREERVEAP